MAAHYGRVDSVTMEGAVPSPTSVTGRITVRTAIASPSGS
jgi:hypothetical protein